MSDRLNRPLALIRLAGLPILSGSVINRVMVVELGLPVILAGLFLAIPLLISPVRLWLGHLSDADPLWGRRREPSLIVGALLAGVGVALSVAPAPCPSVRSLAGRYGTSVTRGLSGLRAGYWSDQASRP